MYDDSIVENAKIGLHDCRTNFIQFNKNILIFKFPKGYYLLNDIEPKKTGKAEMQCHILDEFSVTLYRKKASGKVIREDWSDNFLKTVNNGTFEFEFVSTYRGYQHILFKGYVWFKKPPYHMECEIELHTNKIFYSWNE